jgi:hypothetical protein
MAVLGNYEKENAKIILEAILHKLRKVCKSDDDLKRFTKQLIVISRMRNLEELTTKISNDMPILIDIEKDYLFNLGLQKHRQLLLEAEEALENLKAGFKKAAEEKAEAIAQAKIEAEKAAKEKAEAIAQAIAEKEIALQMEKKAIIKMKKAGLEAAIIMDILNLDKATYDLFLMEIEQNKES